MKIDDSLIAHHAYASHLPQRLAHVVSEYCDANPWKLDYKGGATGDEKGAAPQDLPAAELCEYNAADARVTALAWKRMQVDLEPERAVYEHDLQLARVCHEMSWDGIGVDVERQAELSRIMGNRRAALKGVMRSIIGEADFQPGRLGEVRRVMFHKLRGRFLRLTAAGLPSTNNETLEALRGDDTRLARFAGALLQWRLVGKVKSTYIDAVDVLPTGRAHYNWKPFGTVSGRLSCRLQSCPRWSSDSPEGRVREIYVPRKGNVFVYFDVSQAEMRLAAFISADPVFMRVAQGGDVHAGNAKAVFPEVASKGWLDGDAKKDPARGKPYRDIAKNLGFAIAYGAEAEKVFITLRSQGFSVTMRAVELILTRLRAAYAVYYAYVAANVARVRRDGYMRSPVLGRVRWLGWFPKPTDVSNYPVQSSLADIVNQRMIALRPRLPRGACLVAQVHDSCTFDVPRKLAGEVERLIREQWAEPVTLAGGPLVLPVDLKVGERWNEL